MYKLDLEHLAPRLLKNMDAHTDYIKHTQTQANTIRGIVEQAKELRPLDNSLDYACKYTKHIQELLFHVRDSCPSINKPNEKLVAVTLMNKNKKVTFDEPVTSSRNISKQHDSSKTRESNKPLLPSTGVNSSTSDRGSKPTCNTKKNKISQTLRSNQKNNLEEHPRLDNSSLNKKNRVFEPIFNDVNVRSKSKSAKRNEKKKVWKPTGNMFTEIGYKWKPIERTFTIDGNRCPLTRITPTKVVPRKETIIASVIKMHSRRPKATKSVGSSSKSKTVGSKITNNSEPNQSWVI
ncbi:hypothetical protein Tco_1355896 [Tanacetum coccineum]